MAAFSAATPFCSTPAVTPSNGDGFKGEVLVTQHTPSPDASPLFGGKHPVGIGISGTCSNGAGVMNGTALVGKDSLIFKATLRKLADTD